MSCAPCEVGKYSFPGTSTCEYTACPGGSYHGAGQGCELCGVGANQPFPGRPECCINDKVVDEDRNCIKLCPTRRRLSHDIGPEYSSDAAGDGPELQLIDFRYSGDEDCIELEDEDGWNSWVLLQLFALFSMRCWHDFICWRIGLQLHSVCVPSWQLR